MFLLGCHKTLDQLIVYIAEFVFPTSWHVGETNSVMFLPHDLISKHISWTKIFVWKYYDIFISGRYQKVYTSEFEDAKLIKTAGQSIQERNFVQITGVLSYGNCSPAQVVTVNTRTCSTQRGNLLYLNNYLSKDFRLASFKLLLYTFFK